MILEKMSNFETTSDLLALQARVAQLEAALGCLKSAVALCPDFIPGITPPSELCKAQALKLEVKDAIEALYTPPLDVSPLWRVLAACVCLEELENNCGDAAFLEKLSSAEFTAAIDERDDAIKAITPELRALIAKQAGREQG